MTTQTATKAYGLTLCRDAGGATTAMQSVVHTRRIPITSGSESRVSADLRRLGMALEERFPLLESIEALCQMGGEEHLGHEIPGLILLHRRFPVWLALFDETVFISIDTELIDGNPRARVRQAHEIIDCLRSAGYAVVVDVQTGRVDHDGLTERDLASRVAGRGSTRWFDPLIRDARLGSVFSGYGFAVVSAVMDRWSRGSWPPPWSLAVRGLLFGLLMGATQYWLARTRLRQRLEGIRQDLIAEPGTHETFRKSRFTIGSEVAAVLVFGGFACVGLLLGSWATGLFILAFGVAAVTSLLIGFGRIFVLTADAIESRARAGSTRIAYRDVRQVVQFPAFDTTIVVSDRDWLVVPSGFDHHRRLTARLWDRVDDALTESALQPLRNGGDILRSLRDSQTAGRGDRLTLQDFASPPPWMLLRRHPLRGQYVHQRHLLRQGQLTAARVITANRLLYRPPRDETRFDAPAIVLYTLDAADCPSSEELLDDLAARLLDPHDDATEWFARMMARSRGLPLTVQVPEDYSGGAAVYCTSVMVVRRHLPLGSLKSPWLPLLVSPSTRFAIVLPMRHWGAEMRAAWVRGDVRIDRDVLDAVADRAAG